MPRPILSANAADMLVHPAVLAWTQTAPLVVLRQALEQTLRHLAALLLHRGLQLRLASSGLQQQQQEQGTEANLQGRGL
jgi:hypothetical protein